jgi:hypothetical protein
MKKPFQTLLWTAALIGGALAASAQSFTAQVTSDNHYQLLVGNANGSLLTLVGQNEAGSAGNPGTFNWSLPETWNFQLGAGQRIYVVAWDNGGVGGWLGQFSSLAATLLSRPADWRYTPSSFANPGDSQPNLLPTLISDIAAATSGNLWQSNPVSAGANGASPWGTISGIGASAEWLTVPANSGPVMIFRSEFAGVPEASTWAAVGAAATAAGFQVLNRRRNGST